MRRVKAGGAAGMIPLAGLMACLGGCVTDSEILKTRWGEAGPPAAANPGARTAPRGPTAATRAGWSRAMCFACRHCDDANGNGVVEPDEIVGRSESFTTGDRIAFVMRAGITRSFTRTFRLWDESKTMVYEQTKEMKASSSGHCTGLQFKPGDLPAGTYEGAWSIDGEEVCSSRIVIAGE